MNTPHREGKGKGKGKGCHQNTKKPCPQRSNAKLSNNTNATNTCDTNTNNNNNAAGLKLNNTNNNNTNNNKAKEKHFGETNRSSISSNSTNISRKAAGCNWKSHVGNTASIPLNVQNGMNSTSNASTRPPNDEHHNGNDYIAMDCEMVGCGASGKQSVLARVALVDQQGNVLLDKYVKPQETVTDYRTSISGIHPQDLVNGEDFKDVQKEVLRLIKGKCLVGHSLSKDLAVLHIKHPYMRIRDTSTYKPLRRLLGCRGAPGLKLLSREILGLEIQLKEHNPIEDAQAAMKLYNYLSKDWEKYIKKQRRLHKR